MKGGGEGGGKSGEEGRGVGRSGEGEEWVEGDGEEGEVEEGEGGMTWTEQKIGATFDWCRMCDL